MQTSHEASGCKFKRVTGQAKAHCNRSTTLSFSLQPACATISLPLSTMNLRARLLTALAPCRSASTSRSGGKEEKWRKTGSTGGSVDTEAAG